MTTWQPDPSFYPSLGWQFQLRAAQWAAAHLDRLIERFTSEKPEA